MTSFVHIDYSYDHPGVVRAEAALQTVGEMGRGLMGSRGIAALLMAAVLSALLLIADRLVDTGSGLLAAWMVLWFVAFAGLALFSTPLRQLANAVVKSLDGWSASVAEARADQRLWATTRADARVMADLQAAMARADSNVKLPALTRRVSLRETIAGWQRDVQRARADVAQLRAADIDHRVKSDLQAATSRAEAVPAVTQTLLRADGNTALRDTAHALGARRSYYF